MILDGSDISLYVNGERLKSEIISKVINFKETIEICATILLSIDELDQKQWLLTLLECEVELKSESTVFFDKRIVKFEKLVEEYKAREPVNYTIYFTYEK